MCETHVCIYNKSTSPSGEKVACKCLPFTDSEPPVLPPETKLGQE